ncbi:hypothetical protein Aperf_G00000073125 [Anoplocephala perfoliata]
MLEETELLLVLGGFMIAFVLAFGIGANDVANSFGTSVGSKVLKLKTACILATVFEISGSVLLGGQVSATIRGGIVDPKSFNSTTKGAASLMYGQVASLASACIWMLVATFFKLPVSGSHSIVGSTAGFGLVLFGLNGIKWMGILRIVISWFASPLLSGIVSALIFFILKKLVLVKEHPLEPGLNIVPFLYAATVTINVFSVLYGGLSIFGIREIKIWIVLVASFASGILVGLIVFFAVRPCLRRKILRHLNDIERSKEEGYEGPEESSMQKFKRKTFGFMQKIRHPRCTSVADFTASGDTEESSSPTSVNVPSVQPNSAVLRQDAENSVAPQSLITSDPESSPGKDLGCGESNNSESPVDPEIDEIDMELLPVIKDRPEEAQVFSFVQILSAIFGSFVHGANDVSNAIGPVVGLWLVATTGDPLNSAPAPVWILFYGGVGISIGLWVWGRKVMETVGTDLTTITPSSGVCIELGSAVTVLLASNLGIPISTTHCKVGSVVCVGCLRSRSNVNWKLFVNIILAWIVTLPVSAGLSALIMYAFTRTQPALA